jgi:cell division protease FtsH
MADEIGPITYGQEDEPIFLGKEIARHKDYSEETARRIDEAVKYILETAKDQASVILGKHKAKLEKLADELLVRETLTDDEIRTLLGLEQKTEK